MRWIVMPFLTLTILSIVAWLVMHDKKKKLTRDLLDNAKHPHTTDRMDRFGIPGFCVANDLLISHGLDTYKVIPTASPITNRCDYDMERIVLADHIFDGCTNLSVAVAAHEAGHAYMDGKDDIIAIPNTHSEWISKAMLIEIPVCFVIGVIAYGLNVTDTPLSLVPIMGSVILLLSEIVHGVTECIMETQASVMAIAFIGKNYGTSRRRMRRVSSVLADALWTYVATAMYRIMVASSIVSFMVILLVA